MYYWIVSIDTVSSTKKMYGFNAYLPYDKTDKNWISTLTCPERHILYGKTLVFPSRVQSFTWKIQLSLGLKVSWYLSEQKICCINMTKKLSWWLPLISLALVCLFQMLEYHKYVDITLWVSLHMSG